MFNWATYWFQLTASGLIDALWGEVWRWGLGVGLIILFIAAAFFSPIGKQFFAAAAAFVFVLLVVYGNGIKTEKAVCDARVKVIYLKAHPLITRKNITRKKWVVSPSWDPGAPPKYGKAKAPKVTCSFGYCS